MRVLFWNTNNNEQINAILSEVIIENRIDFVILAEYTADTNELLEILRYHGLVMHIKHSTGCKRISIISNIEDFEPGAQSDYYSVQIISHKYIVCCVHFPSKIYNRGTELRQTAIRELIADINESESYNNMKNTIIVGDFNVDPFEFECINAELLNSLPFYEIASKKSKKTGRNIFFPFYNPMWRFLGDESQPFGTYYYGGSEHNNIYWHLLDQVMIRPSLREAFLDESLQIITSTYTSSLLDTNGMPDKKRVSDHLPIIFEVKEDESWIE